VVVTYSLSGPCQVTVEVLNVAGRLVRRLAANSLAAAGVNNTTWNLRGDSGAAVPGGLYLVRVTAVSDNGQKVQAITQVNVNR
jgi:flagellar hook assembly protein FlgD